jgi:hypothetical protein
MLSKTILSPIKILLFFLVTLNTPLAQAAEPKLLGAQIGMTKDLFEQSNGNVKSKTTTVTPGYPAPSYIYQSSKLKNLNVEFIPIITFLDSKLYVAEYLFLTSDYSKIVNGIKNQYKAGLWTCTIQKQRETCFYTQKGKRSIITMDEHYKTINGYKFAALSIFNKDLLQLQNNN